MIAAGLVDDLHLYRDDPEDVAEQERVKKRSSHNRSTTGSLYSSKRAKRGERRPTCSLPLSLSTFSTYRAGCFSNLLSYLPFLAV